MRKQVYTILQCWHRKPPVQFVRNILFCKYTLRRKQIHSNQLKNCNKMGAKLYCGAGIPGKIANHNIRTENQIFDYLRRNMIKYVLFDFRTVAV